MVPILAALIGTRAALIALVASRFAGFVVVSPFPGEHVSATQRVGFVCVMSWISATFAPTSGVPSEIGAHLVIGAMGELACGLVIGMVFRLILSASDVVAAVFSHSTGLSSPSVFNPGSGAQETAAGRVVTLLAMVVALGVGAHRTVLAYLLESLRTLPVGSASANLLGAAAAPTMVQLAGDALSAGVRISMPLVAVALAVQVALAMIARAAPSLQIFQFGLTIMLGSGALTFVAALPDLTAELGAHIGTVGPTCERVLSVFAHASTGQGP